MIKTDSEYAIGCVSGRYKNFKENRDLVYFIQDLYAEVRNDPGISLKIGHVAGHMGDLGNERADALAKVAVTLKSINVVCSLDFFNEDELKNTIRVEWKKKFWIWKKLRKR